MKRKRIKKENVEKEIERGRESRQRKERKQ